MLLVSLVTKVKLCRAQLVLGLVTFSQAIFQWVGAMSTGSGFYPLQGRNSEFCIAMGPVTRTADTLGCMLA